MKNSKGILDYFKFQNTTATCPACGILILKSKLNIHLNSDCPSSAPSNAKFDHESSVNCTNSSNKTPFEIEKKSKRTKMSGFSKGTSKANSKIGRLSLKHQKGKKVSCSNESNVLASYLKPVKETEIITLDDDSSSTDNNNLKDNNFLSVEIKNESMTYACEQKDRICATLTKSENVPDSPATVENLHNLEPESTGINIREFLTSGKEDEIKLTNSCAATDKVSVTSVHQPLITENAYSSEVKNISISKCAHSSDLSFITIPRNSEGCKLVNNTDINSDVIAVLNDAKESQDEDDNVFTENSESNQHTENYSPYYIANFKHILNVVLQEDCNKILFNEEDMAFVKGFETASDAAQKLYVRLFQRKYKWLRLSKINYPNITSDPGKYLDELVNIGLIDLGADAIDLDTALDLLSLPEAKIIAKQFKFNQSVKSKADITQLLLKHCKEHKSVFFCSGKQSISNMVLKKVKDVLGPCYRISLLPKRLFTRILMLFSLPTMSEDDDDAAGGQQQQLLTLLQVNKGEVTFPNYKINRQMMIFSDRDELIRYEEAKQLENDIMNAVESKNFELAKELYIEALEEFEDQLKSSFVERAASLPTFLKKFTSFHVYVRCMTQGVEILQRLRQYKEAVELLRRLLNQKVFCQDYHGRWFDRLALNLEQHLKQRQQALEAIKEAMKDKNVRVGYRHSLLIRALRILKSVNEEEELKKEIIEAANVIEAPKVVIKGRLFPKSIPFRRSVFISSSGALSEEDDITVLGVEQLAIEHYKNEGFPEGIHGEGSTFHTVYGLLFWDIIYDGDIPDAFISPYQTHPLDLNHDSFFLRREKQIMSHLETLRSSTIEEVKEIAKSTWEAHFGQFSLVMWDHFTDVEHILGLVSCMGIQLLCGICERLARDFRFTRSGVPDLVVWNPESLQVKIVEVKGPGDKLSTKQILWLDYLLKLGAQAEVCLVEAVGSKKLRKE